jgi:hypothetical protein
MNMELALKSNRSVARSIATAQIQDAPGWKNENYFGKTSSEYAMKLSRLTRITKKFGRSVYST